METPAQDEHFEEGPAWGAHAPIMLTHFEGAMDAGAAGTLAVVQMLRNLPAERVATFDADEFIDYRAHRPIMRVSNWVTEAVDMPEIALDVLHDDAGTPVLLLHGPEPDARWESFSKIVGEIAKESGVEMVVSMVGVPAGAPHTRPTPVHVQATTPDLIPDQPTMSGTTTFPAPLTTFLQERLSEQGIDGVTLIAAVPFYLSDTTYSRAASGLLSRLSDLTELALPIGDLERGADEDVAQIDQIMEQNEEIAQTVQALEGHYDQIVMHGSAADRALPEREMSHEVEREESADIVDAIERYLAAQEREPGMWDAEAEAHADLHHYEPDTIADAIARATGQKTPDAPAGRYRPRHRAEEWVPDFPPEVADQAPADDVDQAPESDGSDDASPDSDGSPEA